MTYSASSPAILILGATSLVGEHLFATLPENNRVYCFSRRKPSHRTASAQFSWHNIEELQDNACDFVGDAVIVSLMPFWVLPSLLPCFEGARQLIAFSSTSVFSKVDSQDPAEQSLAAGLRSTEREMQTFCRTNDIACTILRPTLIYNEGHDKNVSAVARFIDRWGFFPIAYPGRGLRQPVHAGDLATAVSAAIDNSGAYNRAFNLGGGETLSYRAMIEKIFRAMKKKPRILPLPDYLPATGLRLFNIVARTEYSPNLFSRMNQDLVFDWSEAQTTLGYQPRPFDPSFD